jgi:hypothetical protein
MYQQNPSPVFVIAHATPSDVVIDTNELPNGTLVIGASIQCNRPSVSIPMSDVDVVPNYKKASQYIPHRYRSLQDMTLY